MPNPIINRVISLGGALSPYLSQSNTLFAAMVVQPDITNKGYIDTFIRYLITNNIWSTIDLLHVYAQGTSQAALLNWVNPGSFTGIIHGIPTFAAYQGFTPRIANPDTDWIDLQYNPSTNAINFSKDNCSFGGYNRINVNGANLGLDIGCSEATNGCYFAFKYSTAFRASANDISLSVFVNADARGFFSVKRTSSANFQQYINGSQVSSNATASSAVPNLNMYSLAINNVGSAYSKSAPQLSVVFIGGNIDQSILYTGIQNYMISLGNQV